MHNRVAISEDKILDAYPVSRVTPAALHHDMFALNFRNKNPIILDGAALPWFGICGCTDDPAEKVIENLEECEAEMLLALDGKNFLQRSLCSSREINLKEEMRKIFSEHGIFQSRENLSVESVPQRKYIRIYFDSHTKLLHRIDLSYLKSLATNASPTTTSIVTEPRENKSDCIAPFKLRNIGLWMSSEGCVTPLHFDKCHGFLAQIIGIKTFLLASSAESDLLRYWREESDGYYENGTTSSVNLGLWLEGNINERVKHPLIEDVAWFIAKLCPGDILYTPPGWWHYVISETASASILIPFDPQPSTETLPRNVLLS